MSIAIAGAHGGLHAYLRSDPHLATLLRGMAVIKMLIGIAAVSVLFWRFGHAIGRVQAVVYLAGAGLIAGATTLIWELTCLPLAALVFHVGAFTLLIAAFVDRKSGTLTTPKFLTRL